MSKYKLEYIWLDGYTPVPNLRGKTLIKEFDSFPTLEELPNWGFDGSSTQQAEGRSSDCVLKPVAVYPDSTRNNGVLVMCEVMMPDGVTPHPTNARATISTTPAPGSASSRNISSTRTAVRSASRRRLSRAAGPYYTGVGYKNVGDIARQIVEEHLDICLDAGINHEGINAEVAKGQWEFQIFGKGSKKRRRRNVGRPLHPAPPRAKSTASTSSSTASRSATRTGTARACTPISRPSTCAKVGGKEYFEKLMAAFEKNSDDHIAVYGPDNHMRLTGLHETESIDKFSYGVADRGASIRVPHSFVNNGYRAISKIAARIRRADPYQIASQILKTIAEVPTP